MDFEDHPFWNFSVQVYQRAEVHEACLALQKRYALDINLLFFCCWVGAAGGGRLEPSQLESAMAAVEGWQEDIVRPIWKSRWLLKPSYKNFPRLRTEPLRRALIEAELAAEHIEQLHLAESMPFSQNQHLDENIRAAHAVDNILLYLKAFAGKKPGMTLEKNDVMEPVLILVAACFSGQNEQRLKSLIEDPRHSI
jgi:uncharacterized protein (TIGR02444 family)